MRQDEYIRKIARESTTIPSEEKEKIIDRFRSKQLTFNPTYRRYYCPACDMPTPKESKYCCNCGQRVTLEKPVYATVD